MSSTRWYLLVLITAALALVAGVNFIQKSTIEHLLGRDATATGIALANYLLSNINDLDRIVAGEPPSARSRAVLDQARRMGHVFGAKIYDGEGRLRMISGGLTETAAEEEILARHNKGAQDAIAADRPSVEAKGGVPPSRPRFYAEAYVPAYRNGKLIGVVEAYVDQTEKRAYFYSSFRDAALTLSGLFCIAFLIPAAAWYYRSYQKHLADARIRYLAGHDALTGLTNRSQLTNRLDDALTAACDGDRAVAIHIIDLDRFKDINDTLGHDAGDALIRSVADRLRAIAQPTDLVGRLGADEFAFVHGLPPDRADAAAEVQGGLILQALQGPHELNGHSVSVLARIGAAVGPHHGEDASRLLKCADLALSSCKQDGRARFMLFTHDLDSEFAARLALERMVREAVACGRLRLHFQPLYKIDGPLTGFEALARLEANDGSLIPPATFIPIAESIGAIDEIGTWVLERACSTACAWPEHLSVAVNLSPAQFTGGVRQVVAHALEETGLAPQRLELEITESMLLGDTENILAQLTGLKALGVSIVMDDFGTGYSSLSYLWRFPFDKLKIDRSFMSASSRADGTAEKIIRTIVTLGHSLRMEVTMEGVETPEQAAFISGSRCDEVQGFYYGRPSPTERVASVIMADFRRRAAIPVAEIRDDDRAAG
jgi:diguanylate cyclase (GGDEF)-like protein